ncbi:MAG: HAD family hydrolase [Selenomonadaceae bacterium]|nr:HAD family hydrolase [Selenomonadaceae bacterium]MBQ3725495.1 HAD family hydrolase [Selenomonadaceae bacterium]
MIRAIFFDRDGVLNEEVGYLWEIEKFKWVNGAREAIKFCNERGLPAIVVTNQGGIARGLYTAREVDALHNFMQKSLSELGAHIDAFYYCPHHPEGIVEEFSVACECRKPKPGLILRACQDFKINPSEAILFGDSDRDIKAADAAGLRAGIFFAGGNLLEVIRHHVEKAS